MKRKSVLNCLLGIIAIVTSNSAIAAKVSPSYDLHKRLKALSIDSHGHALHAKNAKAKENSELPMQLVLATKSISQKKYR